MLSPTIHLLIMNNVCVCGYRIYLCLELLLHCIFAVLANKQPEIHNLLCTDELGAITQVQMNFEESVQQV